MTPRGVREYVNADPIAAGLSAFAPESVAFAAGRVMLARIDELARQRISFGFETTLASRSVAPWLQLRLADGYAVHLVFLWLASLELALARVARRASWVGIQCLTWLSVGGTGLDCGTSLNCTGRSCPPGGSTIIGTFPVRD